tara:strand:- start:25 stop:384 length:360 start_codon:yes stop_codon:yes gene_type:complete
VARYIIIALLVSTLLASITSKVLYDKYQHYKQESITLQVSLDEEKAKSKKARQEASALEATLGARSNDLRKLEKYLESMKGREATVVAKPKLVEKLIQKAVKDREARFECATGGLCEQP